MKRTHDEIGKRVDRLLSRYNVPDEGQMQSAIDRVEARLRSAIDEGPVQRIADVPEPRGWRFPKLAFVLAAGVALFAATLSAPYIRTALVGGGTRARVAEAIEGAVYRQSGTEARLVETGGSVSPNEMLRTNDATAQLMLVDGSRVEMRSRSELSLARANDGLTIRLNTGSIIVNAAKQPHGHLYVQTNDVTVSVVGTVFLVNAEREGSRVAVIEGEVRVRQGSLETKLRPGEHVSSSPSLKARPVKEEIAWSRHLDAYLRLLHQSVPQNIAHPAEQAASAAVAVDKRGADQGQFEEASIRPCDPDNIPPAPQGARGGGANSFQMTPGRTHVLCMTLATIIRTAYGYSPMDLDFLNGGKIGAGRGLGFNNVYGLGVEDGLRVRGPDWVRSERYTIDAVADGAADAETMRGPMLRALLERRFQLKAHIENEQTAAFMLNVAKGGLKMKPIDSNGCEAPPPVTPGQPLNFRPRGLAEVRRGEKPTCGLFGAPNGPNFVFVGGGAGIVGVARLLGSRLGGVQVFDKTGITDRFNFILEFAVDENAPGLRGERFPPGPEPQADVPRGQTIFVALEEQLGLKLEPAKSQRDFIVIDHIERPSAN